MAWLKCMYDISHHQTLPGATFADTIPYFAQAVAAGWPFVIHKLSQGVKFVDNKAVGRLKAAHEAGARIGGYHFYDNTGSASAQIANFMRVRGAVPYPMVLCLDYEPPAPDPALQAGAVAFAAAIGATVGITPLCYTNKYSIAPLQPRESMPMPVWIASYTSDALTNPQSKMPDGWSFPPTWVQYSDGKSGVGYVEVPGIGWVDQSAFDGTLDEAHAWWSANETAAVTSTV